MTQLQRLLAHQKQHWDQLLKAATQSDTAAGSQPEQRLIIRNVNGSPRYYVRNNENPRREKYLSMKKDSACIQTIAQKSYEQQLLQTAQKQSALISGFLAAYSETAGADLYAGLRDERRALITPLEPDYRYYLEVWANVPYEPGFFDEHMPLITTERNERVRSKSEKIAADLYLRRQLAYRYEYPLVLRDGDHMVTLRPDFTVVSRQDLCIYYHEHLGSMDDPKYVNSALERLRIYISNGIFPGDRLLLTFETKQRPLNDQQLLPLLHRYLL